MGTVSLAVISVKTGYICKNRITSERYTLCMYHVAYISRSVAFVLPCILYARMYCMGIQLAGVANKLVYHYYYYQERMSEKIVRRGSARPG